MRVRELVVVAAVAAVANAACIRGNPDPRNPSLEVMERGGFGAWIALTTTAGASLEGELISVEPASLSLIMPGSGRLTVVQKASIAEGSVYKYESDSLAGWAVVGTLSTLSHGFFLIFTAPIWSLSSAGIAGSESRHVIIELARGKWDEVAKWARFPQGMPPGFGAPGYR
jgi:hypothetical protein